MSFLGIDPGVNGGLACLYGIDPLLHIIYTAMPETEQELYNWLLDLPMSPTHALLEKVQGWTGGQANKDGSMGTTQGQPAHTMFRFGQNYGTCRAFLVTLGCQWEAIHPKTWQKEMGIEPTTKDQGSRQDHKRKLKEEAQRLFPSVKITLKNCDALLLAELCKRKYA